MFKGEEWENSIALGMLKAHCFLPILSYGATAILVATSQEPKSMIASWPTKPLGLLRLKGLETDAEDLLLKVAYTRCCYLVPVVITK